MKNVFHRNHLQEIVYLHQPPIFHDHSFSDHICLLQRSLYGLKQAPRAWYHRFAQIITIFGFTHSDADSSSFIYRHGAHTTYLLLYVDDIILSASSSILLQQVITIFRSDFAMT